MAVFAPRGAAYTFGMTLTSPSSSSRLSVIAADADLDSVRGAVDAAAAGGGAASISADTIRMPGPAEDRVVRPALAVLYRLAVGPNADHYVARFFAFERGRRGWPGWSWPAFWLGPTWAGYRGLWFAAFFFAMLPLLAAVVFIAIGPALDHATWLWEAGALITVWALPSCLAAACANYLFYRRVRNQSQSAERETAGPVEAAARLNDHRSTTWIGATAGAAGIALVYLAVVVDLVDAHRDHVVRRHVLDTLAAVRTLEQQVVANWTTARLVPRQTEAVAAGGEGNGDIEDIHVDPATGRVRVAFGPTVPELAGKAILLAPTRDEQQQVRWLCVAVGIERAYLPPECRSS